MWLIYAFIIEAIEALLWVLGEQENEGIYFGVIRERRWKIEGNEGSDGEQV